MNRILNKIQLADKVHLLEVEAPRIARKRKAGQFVIIRITEEGERIPLTIADGDPDKGTITLVIQEVGKTTEQLGLTLNTGDHLLDVTGPLGEPTHIDPQVKHIIGVGGGIGIAPLHPIAQAYHDQGSKVTSIIGARNKELLILEDWMRKASTDVVVCTDDGSQGRKALVTEPLKEMLESDEKIDMVVAIGPAIMMKFVSETTRPFGVKTLVSLNTIMIDGTGMCGGCRVTVGGKAKYVCVDGPEFDGHLVDFDVMMRRQSMYKPQEKESTERWHEIGRPGCRLHKDES